MLQITNPSSNPTLIPLPELPINVRLGTMEDIAFIDELQKKNNRNLGFLHRAALQGKIELGEVLIAEEVASCELRVASGDTGRVPTVAPKSGSVLTTHNSQLATTRLGYLIGNDRYFKRDELGAIFQLCVVPGKRRGLVGATMLKALFDRASYGCKLYCCWCAQDLEANHFWESMGFVPLAFRSGARKKGKDENGKVAPRVHIFWQKRIRAGDNETPWWYPSQTGGGAIGEDRLVLPIPPGVHWSEVKSVVLPGTEVASCESVVASEEADASLGNSESGLTTHNSQLTTGKPKRRKAPAPVQVPEKPKMFRLTGMPSFAPITPIEAPKPANKTKVKREKPAKIKQKNDPTLVKAARELRDRYLEEVNLNPMLVSSGKYDVARLVERNTGETPMPPTPVQSVKLLDVLPVDVKRVEPMAA
ncbi:MAG TPA: hypothetical protein PK402_03615 [Tepidisphaeraceae bacterium]|nr:hypothetical protein [Tepidisphaeraceae bacterium]